MEQTERIALRRAAARLRLDVVEQVYAAQSGHPGGALSSADILTWLYNKELNLDPARPRWPERDRFVLSKGHSSPALYAALARRGFFDPAQLASFRAVGSMLQGHPDMKKCPGVDMTSGSLGQGISAAGGMALAAKLTGASWRVYALLGDGEMEEGQVWEAAMFAAHKKLDNLCWIVDSNGLQIDGRVEDVAGPGPLDKKLEGFGFRVVTVDGHDFDALEAAFAAARAEKGRPTAILAATVKGKGVSFMEDQAGWHGKAPNAEQYARAKEELEAELARWEEA